MCVAVGSLCDENVQYNLPGNLRTWDSITDTTTPLAGHKSAISQTQNEEIWRTVTDVKLSRDRSCIISASHDGSAKVWRTKCGKLISTLCKDDITIRVIMTSN
jgi:WD40 repeat protein